MKDIDNPIVAKSFAYALRIVKLYRYLVDEKREFTLSKDLLVSGTHVGKHVMEAVNAESKQRFTMEMGAALRKASENEYWLHLLHFSEYLSLKELESMDTDRIELSKMLTKITVTSRTNV
ncbi:MAG: four helix bundle protein [Pyrinomonadaceae bacterium]